MSAGRLFQYGCFISFTKGIADMKRKLDKEEEELKTQHEISLMTPEFQVWLVETAIKLAKIGKLFDLLKYIQNEMWLG